MVFSKKDKPAPKPGADRMDDSRKVLKGGKVVEQDIKGKKRQGSGTSIAVILFTLIFAFIYSEFYAMKSTVFSLFEDAGTNKLIFGPGYGVITADPMIDQVITIFARAAFFAALFGVVPFLTAQYAKSRNVNNQDPYKMMWGMTAFVAFAIVLTDSLLWPFAKEIFAQFQLDT